jgi:hypothetical protein
MTSAGPFTNSTLQTQHRLPFLQGWVRPGLSVWHPMVPWCAILQPFSPSVSLFFSFSLTHLGHLA